MRFAESKCIIWVYNPNENGMKTNHHLSNPRSLEFATQEISLLPSSNNICLSNQDQFILELLLRSHRLRRAGMLVGPKTYNDLEICNNQGVYKGGLNWYELENVGLFQSNKSKAGDLHVFPNPGSDIVTFRLMQTRAQLKSIRIFNLTGQLVMECNNANQTGTVCVQIKNLPLGMYSYQCMSSNGLVYSGKLIKN